MIITPQSVAKAIEQADIDRRMNEREAKLRDARSLLRVANARLRAHGLPVRQLKDFL